MKYLKNIHELHINRSVVSKKFKKSVALVAALLLMSSSLKASSLNYVTDCFIWSFDSLEKHIAGLGFEPSIEYQTEYVNDAYAACECLQNNGFYLFDE